MISGGDEYILVGDYLGSKEKLKILHTKCGKEIDILPDNALRQRVPCKYCNPASYKDSEVFMYHLEKKYPGEYRLIGEYKGANKPITLIHTKCGRENTYKLAEGVLRGIVNCPFCHKGSHQNTESFIERITNLYAGEYTVIGEYTASRERVEMRHNTCGFVYSPRANEILRGREKCPVCNKNTRINTTESVREKLKRAGSNFLLAEEYVVGKESHKVKCKECGGISELRISDILSGNIKCPICGDGTSYPEKFFEAFLDFLGEKYIRQYSSKYAKWCCGYKYDFYLPNRNWIIEVNGAQHYEDAWNSYEDTHSNDLKKQKTAMKNGIDKYIVIDCRYSVMEYIRDKIEKSELSVLGLDSVSWKKCDLEAKKSRHMKIIKAFNDGADYYEILERFGISSACYYKIMIPASKSGLLNRDYKRGKSKVSASITKRNCKKVMCIETKEVFSSIMEAEESIHHDGVRHKAISHCANGDRKTAYGYHWQFIDR
ncbi:hypothetical protein [Butyrivibrio sp. FC2001]|uniref:hypothetical protein n=1 Tax=Butyrivibrio sp. FC2001 TaxID=1280671 RepID=UPI0003F9BDF3|nr:hypothetical protein [Butyrivibrio sp. FC2001]